ncbi:uncharacterized protein IWZ02DRAFT_75872 [Phyllosticta citriasiana]|uniref:uncharacterized protein n=1 Tax=Phyllosticta citriasiana TaxID=595635 RepID=UPI0030FD6295
MIPGSPRHMTRKEIQSVSQSHQRPGTGNLRVAARSGRVDASSRKERAGRQGGSLAKWPASECSFESRKDRRPPAQVDGVPVQCSAQNKADLQCSWRGRRRLFRCRCRCRCHCRCRCLCRRCRCRGRRRWAKPGRASATRHTPQCHQRLKRDSRQSGNLPSVARPSPDASTAVFPLTALPAAPKPTLLEAPVTPRIAMMLLHCSPCLCLVPTQLRRRSTEKWRRETSKKWRLEKKKKEKREVPWPTFQRSNDTLHSRLPTPDFSSFSRRPAGRLHLSPPTSPHPPPITHHPSRRSLARMLNTNPHLLMIVTFDPTRPTLSRLPFVFALPGQRAKLPKLPHQCSSPNAMHDPRCRCRCREPVISRRRFLFSLFSACSAHGCNLPRRSCLSPAFPISPRLRLKGDTKAPRNRLTTTSPPTASRAPGLGACGNWLP